jgi:hypothetical protein
LKQRRKWGESRFPSSKSCAASAIFVVSDGDRGLAALPEGLFRRAIEPLSHCDKAFIAENFS